MEICLSVNIIDLITIDWLGCVVPYQVLLRCDGVREDVKQHCAAAGSVHPERHDVIDDRLKRRKNKTMFQS